MTTEDDVSTLAGQLADLTRVVEDLARQITAIRDRATDQQEATDLQQERTELVVRELAEVSSRLQAAADGPQSEAPLPSHSCQESFGRPANTYTHVLLDEREFDYAGLL